MSQGPQSPRTKAEVNRDQSNEIMSQITFPFPFTDFRANQGVDKALTLVDLRMIKLSYFLRSEPSWWIKIKDPAIRSTWKAKSLATEIRGDSLQEAEVEWVLDEIEDYARMWDEETGIQPSCHARVWESDELVSEDLKSRLIRAAAILENVPDEEKDWHSPSGGQVLNLVHPSLFFAVYGRTRLLNNLRSGMRLKPLRAPRKEMDSWAYSDKFCWIPTDFQLGENGTPAKALGYINNVHPDQHKDLISVIESLVGRFSLLWERVLTDIHPDNDPLPGRQKVVGSYTWAHHPDYPLPSVQDRFALPSLEFNRRLDAAAAHRTFKLPTVHQHGYRGSGQDITFRKSTYSIQGRIVQVIVKLANIHLTPEKPEYPGGRWHVEGMANERIVASSIYYYDCENITDSQLSFRVGVDLEGSSYRSDSEEILLTNKPKNQVVGSVKTSPNRCIAFPNIYQHKVSPFKLVDPNKPGHRKIVALFLVDPENRIPSTSVIPPQQSHWTRRAIFEALRPDHHRTKPTLPVELVEMVVNRVDTVMTLAETKAYREEFMEERTAFAGSVNEQHFSTNLFLSE
ncbi:hypothetical protein FRC01_000812 [Tulasnella sp. 417]|nr:hypothetical protein FRC01_000812 [Tulasnella sp. 417]